jgi:aspartokinase
MSYGKRCSVRIDATRLNQIGVTVQAFNAWDVGVFTDDTFGDANVVAIVTGFIGESFL